MKIGIYISGLGQSFVNETVEKYAQRLTNEISYTTTGIEYETKTEKVNYTAGKISTVISICEKNPQSKVLYKIYDFKYHEILTEKFNGYSLILKNLWLFFLVIRKFPIILSRLFNPAAYSRPFQTLYIFTIFIIISGAVLLMLPATLSVVINFFENTTVKEMIFAFKQKFKIEDIPYLSKTIIENISRVFISLTALLILILPNANVLIANLATEFVCANDYIQHGVQRQLLQGNLELLVDYVSENEKDCKIHFHTYSFGSILALDFIYPIGNKVSRNTEMYCEALITVGTPFEFIKSYYPLFYQNRKKEFGDKIYWINLYSIADALATNFRSDSKCGDAQFGIDQSANKPININYEVVALNESGIIAFLMLYSIKTHGIYWDTKTEGASCLRLVYDEMNKQNLI